MTQDELYTYLKEPERLSAEVLPDLKALLEDYPYCSSYVVLYLQALSRTKDLRYSAELKRLALYLPDRRWLYAMLEHTDAQELSGSSMASEAREADAFALIDSFLTDARAQGEDLPDELSYTLGAGDRDDYFASHGDGEVNADELIDVSGGVETLEPNSGAGRQTPLADPSETEIGLDEELFTETLAKIYIQQGKYDRALRIIRSISLNYPKKNLYFADQIRFLELLVNNKQ